MASKKKRKNVNSAKTTQDTRISIEKMIRSKDSGRDRRRPEPVAADE
jgi:hypothetical protein